ncbi:MAG: RNA polymerase factor sigma-54 [Pararhodobacter sp.]
MTLKPSLSPRQSQTLALTPGVRVALSVLRMNAAELDDMATAEAARNPFLLREPRRMTAQPVDAPDLVLPARAGSFQQSLDHQIGMMALEPGVAALARLLIGELRNDGLLDTPLSELAETWGLPITALEQALDVLQRCEPAGIGARDLRECLSLQLVDAGLSQAAAAETIAHLPLFAAGDWSAIGRRLGLAPQAARERAALLRGLSPRPVEPQASADAPPVAVPDLVLERLPGGGMRLVPPNTPTIGLRMDEALVARARREGFGADLLTRARAVIDALAQRGQTLARIGEWLLEHQHGFLSHGPQALRPVTRVELAQALNLHPSTIGRAVAGKHILIDGMLWPLSRLFSNAMPSLDGPVSAFTLQQRIATMIGRETAGAPLSDEEIAHRLRAEGVDIARRTVAKYRQGLRIPASASRRRQARLAQAGGHK